MLLGRSFPPVHRPAVKSDSCRVFLGWSTLKHEGVELTNNFDLKPSFLHRFPSRRLNERFARFDATRD